MRSLKVLVLTFFTLFTMFQANLAVAEDKVSGSASVDIVSNYVWRGQKLSDEIAYQPSLDLGYKGFGMNIWMNYDDKTKEETETDLTLSYSYSYKFIGLEVGYIHYSLDGVEDTQEVYGGVSLDVPLNPSVTYYYDYDVGDGGYLLLAIGESFSVNKMLAKINMDPTLTIKREVTLNLGASAGINLDNEVLGFDSNGKKFSDFYDGNINASLDIPIIDKISVSPMIAYSFAISNDAETAIQALSFDQDKEVLYGGIGFSFSF